jgi:hypothetical protein
MGQLVFKMKPAKTVKPDKGYIVLESKVEGIINYNNITKEYKVIVNKDGKEEYNITKDSFRTKGKRIVYSKYLDNHGNYIKIYRDKDNVPELNSNFYLPFKPGLTAKGRIVQIEGKKYFHIISCYSSVYNDEIIVANDEFKQYKDGY